MKQVAAANLQLLLQGIDKQFEAVGGEGRVRQEMQSQMAYDVARSVSRKHCMGLADLHNARGVVGKD